jgi:hypothetical protein
MKSSQSIRDRLQALISKGDDVRATIRPAGNGSGAVLYTKMQYEWDRRLYASWLTSCVALVDALNIKDGNLKSRTDILGKGEVTPETLDAKIGILVSLAENIDLGLLRNMEVKISGEISYDFMAQAEALLVEPGNLEHGYIPAAVLSGAVLERSLRTICEQASPCISVVKSSGEFKSMDALINELDQAKIVNSNGVKQLRAWAGLRNSAAHGRFEEFNKSDVQRMIAGVNDFISENLG